MSEREFLQQLYLLRADIESCPMLDAHAAEQRNRWAARLGDLLMRRLAAAPISADAHEQQALPRGEDLSSTYDAGGWDKGR